MEINYILNDREQRINSSLNDTVLNYLRERVNLKGTKEGCGEGECGACSVLLGSLSEDERSVNYISVPSCLLPIMDLDGKHLVTIEGLSKKKLTPVQDIFVDEGAIQCGFCTPGFIVSITAYLISGFIDEKDIVDAIDGHICRCTGYNSIKKAIKRIDQLEEKKSKNYSDRIEELINLKIVPEYFNNILDKLIAIKKGKKGYVDFDSSIKNLSGKKIIAGGTDILVQNNGKLPEGDLIYFSNVKELSGITRIKDFIHIKSNTIIEDLKNSSELNTLFPGFDEYLSLVSSKLIRNRATVAGNIANASPIGDISILFLAMRSELILKNDEGNNRTVKLEEFFRGYKDIDLLENEIIYEIKIPIPKKGYRFNFEKVSQRKYLDIASCNSAILIKIENNIIIDCCISAGGVFAYPLYLKELSQFLIGKKADEESIELGDSILNSSISPISDIRGSEKYKRLLLKNLLKAHMNLMAFGR